MAETTDKARQEYLAEAKLTGLRRVLEAIRREYGAAREEGASEKELEVIGELGREVSVRVERGEKYVEGLEVSEGEDS